MAGESLKSLRDLKPMKNHPPISISLTLPSLTCRTQAGSPSQADAEQAITKLREGLIDSFNRGDIDRLLTHLDTNAVVTWQNGEVCIGPAAVKAYHDRMMKGDHPVVRKVTANPKLLGRHLQGDWAVSWGELNDEFVLTDGRELPLKSRFTATLVQRGDRWLISAFHASVNAFDNPILGVAIQKSLIASGIAGLVIGALLAWVITRSLRRRSATR